MVSNVHTKVIEECILIKFCGLKIFIILYCGMFYVVVNLNKMHVVICFDLLLVIEANDVILSMIWCG